MDLKILLDLRFEDFKKIVNKVWIGCRSLILKGAEIPDNYFIGANSFVNKKFELKNIVIAGNPAKVVKENVKRE